MLKIIFFISFIILDLLVIYTMYAETYYNSITTEVNPFNIAIAADWGCNENAKKTSENIQKKNPELVIGAGDYSYTGCRLLV